MVKADVESTLKHVCNKLLRDKSVTPRTIERRAQALQLLGEEYSRRAVSQDAGLEDFLSRMGASSGLFGQEQSAAQDPAGKTENPLSTGGMWTRQRVADAAARVQGMSVRELKEHVAMLGGSCEDCVEKSDLRNRVNDLLGARLLQLDDEQHEP